MHDMPSASGNRKISYYRCLKLWIPNDIRYRLQSRYGVDLVRSSNSGYVDPGMWVQTLRPIAPHTALMLDIELSEYILAV